MHKTNTDTHLFSGFPHMSEGKVCKFHSNIRCGCQGKVELTWEERVGLWPRDRVCEHEMRGFIPFLPQKEPQFFCKGQEYLIDQIKTGPKSILKISLTHALKCWKLVGGPQWWLASPGGITWCSHVSLFCWEEWVLCFLFPLVVEMGASSGAEMGFWNLLRQSPVLWFPHQRTAESSLWIVCLDHGASDQTWEGEGKG